jgi:hypothetical protein
VVVFREAFADRFFGIANGHRSGNRIFANWAGKSTVISNPNQFRDAKLGQSDRQINLVNAILLESDCEAMQIVRPDAMQIFKTS